jgi:peptide/nickel transport system ATP-binding protein
MARPLLEVEGLTKHFPVTSGAFRQESGRVHAVDDVSFTLDRGETLGLVGESGCGKSTVARTVLHLERPTGGSVRFDGEDVTGFEGRALKRFRRSAQMIFQDPTSSFDPRMSIGESVVEPLRIHGVTDRDTRRHVGEDLLDRVGLDAGDFDRYPHELSGGQRQRVAIARALSVNPDLIVADEPVSALDVSVQSEILSLLASIQERFDVAILFISHDLSVVREICDRTAVMYLGEIVEAAPTDALFENPQHPYTRALLAAIPEPDPRSRREPVRLSGDVPSAENPPAGCRFHTRCPAVIQPADVELDQAVWRAVLDFREQVERGDLAGEVEAIRGSGGKSDGGNDETVAATLRERADLPETIGEPAIEDAVRRAIDRLLDGDREEAREALSGVVQTPCAAESPRQYATKHGWEAACLRHDDRFSEPL